MALVQQGDESMNTSVEYRLMMGNADVNACLARIRQEKIRKAMRNYELDDLTKDTFLDEILAIEREYQEKIEEYNKIFEYALSFEKDEKGE
nr:MAG TPA: hypothetical protein [Bacteriophage sp.]